MTRKRILLIVVLSLMFIAILITSIRFFSLPNMEGGVIYKNHKYEFMTSERYGYNLRSIDLQTKKAIGRFDDAVIYTIKNDPEEFYLYPKVFLPHLPYNLLCRIDDLPSPTDGNIDHMVLYVKDEHGENEAAYHETKVSKEMENDFIDAFKSNNILTNDWKEEDGSEIATLTVYFSKPIGLYYRTSIIQYGDDYGLLLDDDKTLAKVRMSMFQD